MPHTERVHYLYRIADRYGRPKTEATRTAVNSWIFVTRQSRVTLIVYDCTWTNESSRYNNIRIKYWLFRVITQAWRTSFTITLSWKQMISRTTNTVVTRAYAKPLAWKEERNRHSFQLDRIISLSLIIHQVHRVVDVWSNYSPDFLHIYVFPMDWRF